MKKSDLRNGMVVEYRDGTKRLFLDGDLLNETLDVTHIISAYNDDLTAKYINNLDIMKVYSTFTAEYGPIWERKDEIDWSQVKIDTPIWCKDEEEDEWIPRHFAKYQRGKVYCFTGGTTSHTQFKPHTICSFTYNKLAD